MSSLVEGHAWENTRLPLWVRVWVYAVAHHGEPLERGHLTVLFGVKSPDISRAIRNGIDAGLLAHDSSARALWARRAP